jgi:4-amino-4-deoxy-L-arabinose transferase-like glycosyltransferase
MLWGYFTFADPTGAALSIHSRAQQNNKRRTLLGLTRPKSFNAILKSTRATRWVLLALTWVAFLSRTATLAGQSLWRDEVDAIRFSDWPLPELVTGLLRVGHNGPLFFLLLRPWRGLTGDSEFALRYPAALLGALAVPLGFVLARQLGYNRQAGLLLALLLATSPYLVWYGQEAKMYALLLVLVSLAFVAYLRALGYGPKIKNPQPLAGATPLSPSLAQLPSPGGRGAGGEGHLHRRGWLWWAVFVTATTLSFYTHILAPLMLPVYLAAALLLFDHLRVHRQGWLISMALLTLPYLPLAVWQAPLLLDGYHSGHPFYPLSQQISIILQLYSSGLVRFINSIGIVLYVFLFLGGLFLPAPKTGNRKPKTDSSPSVIGKRSTFNFQPVTLTPARLILAAWVLLPLLLVYLISLRVQVFEDRYLIYLGPPFYLLVVTGVLGVRRYSWYLAGLALGLILAINLMGIWQQQRQPIKADFRAAAAYLSTLPQPPSPIMGQMPYLQFTLDYYYKGDYTFVEGLWTNDDKTEAAVAAEMEARTAGLSDLWLVVSEEEVWDNRRLTRAWLDTHAQLVDRVSFMRVEVYHYRFQPGTREDRR